MGESELLQVPKKTTTSDLWKFVATSLKIGTISFGSPTAHIAMMENEFVRKHKWLSQEHFLEMLSAANLIPGPNASEVCYHVGYLRAGYPGLILGGLAFILPSFITSVIIAMLYQRYGMLPQAAGLFYVLNPLVLAIVLDTTWRLSTGIFKDRRSIALFALALLARLLKMNETLILLVSGLIGIFLFLGRSKDGSGERPPSSRSPLNSLLVLPIASINGWLGVAQAWFGSINLNLFLYFLKTGSVMFGSAMVLFGLIETDITSRFGWLSLQQLTDAIAVGQITPGPITSSVSFIGYLVNGLPGAIAAMGGAFLPSFILVMITAPLLAKWRENKFAKAFLKGVNAAVVALILAVAWSLARNALTDVWTFLLLGAGLLSLAWLRLPPYVLVISGLALGFARAFLLA